MPDEQTKAEQPSTATPSRQMNLPNGSFKTATTTGNATLISGLATILSSIAISHGIPLSPLESGALVTMLVGIGTYIIPHR